VIVLHHCHQSRSMRTLWLLNELGVDFDVIVHPFGKALRAPDYLEKHPLGRVPALEMGGAVHFESGAIAEILTEAFPESGLGRMPQDPDRPDYLVWLHFAETVSTHVQILTQQHIVLYEDHMRSPTVMKLEAKRLTNCYAAVEDRLGDGRAHLLRSGFSAADIGVAQAVWLGRVFAKHDGFPRMSAWLSRLSARPAFRAALPPEGADLIYSKEFYEVPGD
jgi:glutathione S-transferase